MKILIIVQDLRISGTSEGIVSRSFITRLRKSYPEAVIDVHYFMSYEHNYDKELLSVNSISEYKIKRKPPLYIKFSNAIYRRLFFKSIYRSYYLNQFKNVISEIAYEKYDQIFIRSSGLEYETILASKDLPILRKAIINFHDPYPFFFDTSSKKEFTKREFLDFREMYKVIQLAKACITPSSLLSKDLQMIYGNNKKFYTLPHQYDEVGFNLSDVSAVRKKEKVISLSYHGGLQFGRNIDILLDAFVELCDQNKDIKDNVEMVFRLKSSENKRLKEKYLNCENIYILEGLNFSNSANEQKKESDIILIVESYLDYSNILLGKAPFVASLNKPIFALLPFECELRKIIKDKNYIATSNDLEEIKEKLHKLIVEFRNHKLENPFNNYFSLEQFINKLKKIN